MHPRRRQSEQHIARRDRRAGEQPVALDRADAKAREVVVAFRVHARHFRRLAADQRATRLLATLADARDHAPGHAGLQLAAGIIVEKEQRLRALHDQVVDAHRDQVDADALMPVVLDRELELGPDPVVRRHQ